MVLVAVVFGIQSIIVWTMLILGRIYVCVELQL